MKIRLLIRLFIIILCLLLTLASCTSRGPGLPDYEVLDVEHMIDGGKNIEILVPSYSRDTPVEELTKFCLEIKRIDEYLWVYVYCTREAYEAKHSLEYARKHPGALDEGYLGYYEYDHFRPPHR